MVWYETFTHRTAVTTTAGTNGETVEEVHSEQNWPMLIALAIFALALAILIALAARAVYHHVHTVSPFAGQNLPAPPPTNLQSS